MTRPATSTDELYREAEILNYRNGMTNIRPATQQELGDALDKMNVAQQARTGNHFYIGMPPGATAIVSGTEAIVKGGVTPLQQVAAMVANGLAAHCFDGEDVPNSLDEIACLSVDLAEIIIHECECREAKSKT